MTINRDSAFGDLLRRCRLAAGLTQEELAERSGVSPRGIGDLERGIRRVPHLNTVRLLAGALGLGDAEREHFVSMARRRASREEAGPTSSDDARVASPTALPHDWSTGMTGRFERESRPDDISPRHNLPTQLTSFIGRERELAEIADQLSGPKQVRLLTLVGAGGCGKTRLALQAGATLLATYPDGVWMAELAALNDPDLVVPTVAAVLGIQSLASTPILDQLVDALKDRRLLVILDNCEHVIGACASLADTLLRGCRTTQILATSREALRIAGEVVWRVPSLSLPTFAEASTLATRQRDPVDWLTPGSLPPRIVASDWVRELEQTEAVQLFVERARAVAPDFVLTASNIAEVVRICYLLDGIPLALELAAARVRMLPVDEIATRLDQSLDLLTGGSRVALPRQQTLRATLVWSYELLTDAERALFNRLAVFVGGFTLEAVEAVCGDDLLPDLLDLLTRVLDRSLIEIEPRAVSPRRYRLLETLHQYATERLVEMGELETFRARHAAYYQVWATKVIPELQGTNRKSGLDRLEPEHDNLRAALRFLIDRQDADGVSRFCDALTQLWLLRGYIPEGRAWLTEILPLVEASGCGADHARLLAIDGRLAHKQSDWTGSVTRQNQSLAIWRQLGDREGMASELGRLGLTVRAMGDYVAARTFFEESLSLYRELGKEEEAGKQLDRLGVIAFYQGDDATAQAFLAESLKIRRRLGDPYWLGWSLREAGMVAHGQGDLATARSRLEEALLIWRELGYQEGVALALADFGDLLLDLDALAPARLVLTESLTLWRIYGGYLAIVEHDLECLGGLAGAEERVYRAVTLWGAAARLREMLGEPLPPNLKTRLERRMGPVRDALFADAFRQSWLEGQAMTVERAVVYALGDDGPNS